MVTGFLSAATIVAYADELGLLAKILFSKLQERNRPELPAGVLDMAVHEIESNEPERIERGLSILRMQPGKAVTQRLVPLLSHPRPEVSRRAAQLLFERQDPGALEALYWYHAQARPAHA